MNKTPLALALALSAAVALGACNRDAYDQQVDTATPTTP